MERLYKYVESAYSYFPDIKIIDVFELVIMCLVVYRLLLLIKDTRAWVFVKGILVLLIAYAAADVIGFHVIRLIFDSLFGMLAILMVVLFQQEIKKIIAEIGKNGLLWKPGKKKDDDKSLLSQSSIEAIVEAAADMSEARIGALILIERDIPLKEWSDTGIKVDAEISRQMVSQIFEKNTPLHDGAVIIKNNRIESATCYLPLSKNDGISKSLGTRHRAGIGISEVTDAFVLIVSEETGRISVVQDGDIQHKVTPNELRNKLNGIVKPVREARKFNVWRNMNIKTISVVATLILWIVLTNISDPVVKETIHNVPVMIRNETEITGQGLSYHITSGGSTDIEVKGRRSVLKEMKDDDVFAYADLGGVSISNAVEISSGTFLAGIETTPCTHMMKIQVEDTKSVDYNISIETDGNAPSSSYINAISLENESVKISGPVSKVDVIGNVAAKFDVSSASDGSILTAPIRVYDRNGKDMTDDVSLSYETASAKVSMFDTKTVPLTVSLRLVGTKGEITSYDYDKNEITIAAEKLELETVNTVFMEIPIIIDEKVDTSEFVKVVNLKDYLPDNIYLAEKEPKLNINVSYEKYSEVNITIQGESVELSNRVKKYDYEVEPITVRAEGLIEEINILQLTGTADVDGLEPGVHMVDVNIDSKYVKGNYTTAVHITEAAKK